MQLAQRLVRRGVLKPDDLARIAEAHAHEPARPLHELLVERNSAKEEDVLATLGEEIGLPFEDLTNPNLKVDPEILKDLPLKLVLRHNLMPLRRENAVLVVATGDPFNVYALDDLAMLTGLEVQPVLAQPREIARLLMAHFDIGRNIIGPAQIGE